MVTELRKTVVRRMAKPYDHRGKRLIVQLEPGDVITFREERSRKSFSAPLAQVFRQIVRWNVESTKQPRRRRVKRGIL